MKVLLVTDQHLKIEGDKITSTANFANALKRLALFGEIHVCARDAYKSKNHVLVFNTNVNEYVKKENVILIPKSNIWPSSEVKSILRNEIRKVDLVVTILPCVNAEAAALISAEEGKKNFAIVVACTWDGLWNQDFKRKLAAPYRFLINRKVLRQADYALYVTNKLLQHRYPAKTRKSIGVSDVVLDKTDDTVLKRRIGKILNKTDKEPVKLATTAMLHIKYKGQRFVLKALKELKDRGFDNYRYYLIGGGDDTELRKLTEKLGLSDQVVFVGKVTHEEVFRILDDIDIYVHPSLQEGMPRSVVEAMSRALPCIGAPAGDVAELIDKEFIVPKKSSHSIAEKILLLRDPQLCVKQAERNFREAQKFECSRLDSIRGDFYRSIKADFE